MKRLLGLVVLCVPVASLAALPPGAKWIEIAKGVKAQQNRDGRIVEVHIVAKTKMTPREYKQIGEIKGLLRLTILSKDEPLTDETAKLLSGLDQLREFNGDRLRLTDDGFRAFTGWRDMARFAIGSNWKPDPSKQETAPGAGLAHLASLPKLVLFACNSNRLDEKWPEALAQAKGLKVIRLKDVNITDKGLAAFKSLKLTEFTCASAYDPSRISDTSLVHLGAIPTLEKISVQETWLTYSTGFTHLKKLPALKEIDLTNVIATEADIEKLKADHPKAKITWKQPDTKTAEEAKQRFIKYRQDQQRSKPLP